MDKNYWENYYRQQNKDLKPSLFALYIREYYIVSKGTLMELGCGNGRDAVFFANEELNVTAIDQCEEEIKFLTEKYRQLKNIQFLVGDFSSLPDGKPFDLIYSRFTLHSVSTKQEQKTLAWAYRNLKNGGYFGIEARGQKNEIYRLGEKVKGEKDAYIYNNHYRRFINFNDLCANIKNLGFQLIFAAEEKGFAPFAGQNEQYIRIIAKK